MKKKSTKKGIEYHKKYMQLIRKKQGLHQPKKKSNRKLKKAVLKHTIYNPKCKYKVVYPFSVFGDRCYATLKSARYNMLRLIKKDYYTNTAILYQRKKNAKGLFQWKKIGKYTYNKQSGKLRKL